MDKSYKFQSMTVSNDTNYFVLVAILGRAEWLASKGHDNYGEYLIAVRFYKAQYLLLIIMPIKKSLFYFQ